MIYNPGLIVSVALGGAIGACCRLLISNWINERSTSVFPYATLAVNALGAFLAGIAIVIVTERLMLSDQWRGFLLIGLLGSLTTFSTFSLELVQLLSSDNVVTASVYVLSSVVLCVLFVFIGMQIARIF